MPKYVDGFVMVIPKDKTKQYKEMAIMGRDNWMKHGALGYYECQGNDLSPLKMGDLQTKSFPQIADAKNDENVWLSFIIFESKAHRDEVNAKVMADMAKQAENQKDMDMPFDMKRMCYGGFEVEVEG